MHFLPTEYDVGMLAERRGGKHQVLGGTAEAHPEMMVVRIDGWRAAREIGAN